MPREVSSFAARAHRELSGASGEPERHSPGRRRRSSPTDHTSVQLGCELMDLACELGVGLQLGVFAQWRRRVESGHLPSLEVAPVSQAGIRPILHFAAADRAREALRGRPFPEWVLSGRTVGPKLLEHP